MTQKCYAIAHHVGIETIAHMTLHKDTVSWNQTAAPCKLKVDGLVAVLTNRSTSFGCSRLASPLRRLQALFQPRYGAIR